MSNLPDKITRRQAIAALKALGLDVDNARIRSVDIQLTTVTVTTLAPKAELSEHRTTERSTVYQITGS